MGLGAAAVGLGSLAVLASGTDYQPQTLRAQVTDLLELDGRLLLNLPLWQRLGHGYLTADISYVLFTRKYAHPGQTPAQKLEQVAYLAGNDFLNWLSWIIASLVGIGLANIIPTAWGLGFAGILCLLGIQCSLASSRMRLRARSSGDAVTNALTSASGKTTVARGIGERLGVPVLAVLNRAAPTAARRPAGT